jgi:hypothetical protein
MKRKIKFWTSEEDNSIAKLANGPALRLATFLKKTKPEFASRSEASIYQRILYVRLMVKEKRTISYGKPGVKVGTKKGTYKKKVMQVGGKVVDTRKEAPVQQVKEITLPTGMSLDFTGKRITISDTYIKIYI